eukprot:1158250-Ditylum_brightwellii.AAC.1
MVLRELEMRTCTSTAIGGGGGGGDVINGTNNSSMGGGGGNMTINMQQAYGPAVFAATALCGVGDCHPFNDGNGRLS